MKVRAAVLVVLTMSQTASAQIKNKWGAPPFFEPALSQLGVYLTAPVADQYRRATAARFKEGAVNAGFSTHEATVFSNSMLAGDIKFKPGGEWGYVTSGNGDVEVKAEPGHTKGGYLLSFRTVESAASLLEQYSTIKLIVKPAPPRDYKVTVNGEQCPATESGIYKVMPGESILNATRPSKPKCEWHGSIPAGAVQEVNCKL